VFRVGKVRVKPSALRFCVGEVRCGSVLCRCCVDRYSVGDVQQCGVRVW